MTVLLLIIYLAFISLGLPDGLLGASWPGMYPALGVPVSWQGVLSVTVSFGTVVSSLASARVIRRFGTARVTVVSVGMTAAALLAFSASGNFWLLWLCCIPLGLGAGSVDTALNNYVALHYAARHMSWLHCFWGVGAMLGPIILSARLAAGAGWRGGYRAVGLIQIALTAALALSLPLWRGREAPAGREQASETTPYRTLLQIPGVRAGVAAFFCYCALEACAGLWAASYFVLCKGVDATVAAGWASLFYMGITAGRVLTGFLTVRYTPDRLIRMGQAALLAGLVLVALPLPQAAVSAAGMVLVGFGCAPVYPCMIKATPEHFGAQHSQEVIGLQMACAYVGTTFVPPVFGLLARGGGAWLLPWALLVLLCAMVLCTEKLVRDTAGHSAAQ